MGLWKTLKFPILSFVANIVVYPALVPVLILALAYRNLIELIVKWREPTCRKMLSGLSAFLAGPHPYSKRAMSIAQYFVFSETINREKIIQSFSKLIIMPNMYPELSQRLVRRWGFYFWKDVENFKLDNHIRYLQPEFPNKPVSITDLRGDIGEGVVYSSFNYKYSPWEIILVPNFVDPDNPEAKSAMFFQFNHCLMDAFSLFKLLEKTSANPWEWPKAKIFSKNYNRKSYSDILGSLIFWLKLILTAPAYFLKTVVFSTDSSEFLVRTLKSHQPKKRTQWSREINEPPKFRKEQLKMISVLRNTNVSTVITTVVTAGVAEFIKLQCYKNDCQMPESFVVHLVLPLPNHPDCQLMNHWTAIRLRVRTSECGNPIAFLRKLDATMGKVANSVEPTVNYLVSYIAGFFPVFLLPDPSKDLLQQTVISSNFPGPRTSVDIFGYKKLHWSALASGPEGTAFVIASQNLYDNLWIDAGFVSTLSKNPDDVILLQSCFRNVLQKLLRD